MITGTLPGMTALLIVALILLLLFGLGGFAVHLLWWGLIIALIVLVVALVTRGRVP